MPTPVLHDLAATLPSPTPAQRSAPFAGADPASFVAVGRRVASSRILTDTSRLYGQAAVFWHGADAELRSVLVGFSPELLAVAVDLAVELDRALDVFQGRGKADSVSRDTHSATYGAAWSTSMRQRDLGARALAPVAGADATRKTLLATTAGTAANADELVRGLRDLAGLGRLWMAEPALAAAVSLARLDAAWADRLDEAAAELERVAAADKARASASTTQGSLDDLDGRNLHLLDLVIDLFDAAHGYDPRVPRLIPIATAWVLGRRNSTSDDAGTDPTEGTPTP